MGERILIDLEFHPYEGDIMKLSKSDDREKKRKKRNKMIVTGKSVFIIQNAIIKRGDKK